MEVRVKGSLSPRTDNGKINSSPITAELPVFRLQLGATHTISIPGKVIGNTLLDNKPHAVSQQRCRGQWIIHHHGERAPPRPITGSKGGKNNCDGMPCDGMRWHSLTVMVDGPLPPTPLQGHGMGFIV